MTRVPSRSRVTVPSLPSRETLLRRPRCRGRPPRPTSPRCRPRHVVLAGGLHRREHVVDEVVVGVQQLGLLAFDLGVGFEALDCRSCWWMMRCCLAICSSKSGRVDVASLLVGGQMEEVLVERVVELRESLAVESSYSASGIGVTSMRRRSGSSPGPRLPHRTVVERVVYTRGRHGPHAGASPSRR